eukprot:11334936-Karenia_brevis.AAC.1
MKHGKDMTKDKITFPHLRGEIEKAKRALSSTHQARVEIAALSDGFDLSETLTHAHFEEINSELIKNILGLALQVMEDAGSKENHTDEIVPASGRTCIPKIRQLITHLLNGKEPNRGIHPKEAVTWGAVALSIDNCVFDIVATNSATHLGGEDFEQREMLHVIKIFNKKQSKDRANDNTIFQSLHRKVEKAKRALRATHQARVEIEALLIGLDLSQNWALAHFEEINSDFFAKVLDLEKR